MLKKTLTRFAVVWFIALIVFYFLYLVKSHNANGPCAGFGRHLSKTPMLMRIFFGQNHVSVDWRWVIGDNVIFLGGLSIAVNVVKHLASK